MRRSVVRPKLVSKKCTSVMRISRSVMASIFIDLHSGLEFAEHLCPTARRPSPAHPNVPGETCRCPADHARNRAQQTPEQTQPEIRRDYVSGLPRLWPVQRPKPSIHKPELAHQSFVQLETEEAHCAPAIPRRDLTSATIPLPTGLSAGRLAAEMKNRH